MYNMDEFYEFHGINRAHFAKMLGITYASLMHYESGIGVSDKTKLKIEIGMQIMEDYALRYHASNGKYDGRIGCSVMDDENEFMDKIFNKYYKRVILMEL